jgi:hypothetical protein
MLYLQHAQDNGVPAQVEVRIPSHHLQEVYKSEFLTISHHGLGVDSICKTFRK